MLRYGSRSFNFTGSMTTPHKINRKPHKKKLHKNAMTKPRITGYA
jgi:hypothetical protein